MPAVLPPFRRPDPSVLARLRARVDAIDSRGLASARRIPAVRLGADAIDSALPWGGLPRGAVHEVAAADASAAALGFSAVLLAHLSAAKGTVVWCRRDRGLYPPGLAAFGLESSRLLMVHARTEADLFWAMEEALKSRGLGAVLGETASAPPVNVRRLQLATEEGGVPLVLLRPFAMRGPAASAVTRWRIAAAPSRDRPAKGGAEPLTRWRVELVRCRGGVSGAWMLDWCDETARLGVVADLRDRPVAAIEPRPPLSAAG